MKKTKIVATLGPSSDNQEIIEQMITEGVNLFRFNFSHGTHEYHLSNLEKVKKSSLNTQKYIGTLQDISGPKIRVNKLEDKFLLKENDEIFFLKNKQIVGRELSFSTEEKSSFEISITNSSVLNNLKVGEFIYLADGSIKLKVKEIFEDKILTIVQNAGVLTSNKGVNFPNTEINIDIITEKDIKDIEFGVINEFTFMALSFVQNANDVLKAKQLIEDFALIHKKPIPKVIAKIEKFDAVNNIDSIIEVSDGIMIARGDLGIEIPFYKVPLVQKEILKKANKKGIPVITATQVMLSMTENETATRAEISDVANAVLDGTDAIMLSEETAVGINPVNVIKTMAQTIVETETGYDYYNKEVICNELDAIGYSAVKISKHIENENKKIFMFTTSGGSVKTIAKFRPEVEINVITHSKKVAEELSLTWGVEVKYIFNQEDSETGLFISKLLKEGIKDNVIDKNGTYVIIAGYPAQISGNINFIRVIRETDIDYFLNK